MRILLTSNYPLSSETGAAQITDLLVEHLSLKNQVIYICVGKKFRVKKASKNLKIIFMQTVSIKGIALPYVTPQTVIAIHREIEKFDPQIVHTQNSVLVSKLIQMYANQKGIPVVTTFHHIPTKSVSHMLPQFSKNILSKVVQELYIQTSLKSFLDNIQGVIAVNPEQMRSVKKVNSKVKIKVINNGLILNGYFKNKPHSLDKSNVRFVFLGSYIPRKNQELLVKTFKYLPKQFTLNCYGNTETGSFYLKKISKIIPSNVKLNGYAKNIPEVLFNSDFFITASLREVQSLAIIQSMAAGLPVIGLKNETVAELINPKNGLALPKNITPKKFAGKIMEFVSSCDYKSLSKQAKSDSKKFNIKKVVKDIQNFYKEVLKAYSHS